MDGGCSSPRYLGCRPLFFFYLGDFISDLALMPCALNRPAHCVCDGRIPIAAAESDIWTERIPFVHLFFTLYLAPRHLLFGATILHMSAVSLFCFLIPTRQKSPFQPFFLPSVSHTGLFFILPSTCPLPLAQSCSREKWSAVLSWQQDEWRSSLSNTV